MRGLFVWRSFQSRLKTSAPSTDCRAARSSLLGALMFRSAASQHRLWASVPAASEEHLLKMKVYDARSCHRKCVLRTAMAHQPLKRISASNRETEMQSGFHRWWHFAPVGNLRSKLPHLLPFHIPRTAHLFERPRRRRPETSDPAQRFPTSTLVS